MKTKIFFITLAFTTFCNAQIINFPNANFKTKLLSANATNNIATDLNGNYIDIDTNNDNEIQESEAVQVKELNLFNSNNVSNIEGINSFINLTKLEFSNSNFSSVGLTSADLTGLILLNYLNIICGTLNLGQKDFLETLYIPSTFNLNYNSNTATIKYFRGKLSAFTSVDYLKRLNLEKITFTFVNKVPYEVLKYHTNLKELILLKEISNINNEFGNLDFTTYNALDNPIYPQNIKKLVVQNLTQFFPIQNFTTLEDLTFYSVGTSDCSTCIIFNPNNFLNLKYLTFYRRNSNPISHLNLSVLSNLNVFKTDSYVNPMTQESLSSINFGNNNNLVEIYIGANPFSILDFTQTPNIKIIDLNTVYKDANGTGTASPTNIIINLAQDNLLENFRTRCYARILNNNVFINAVANLTINNLQESTHLKEVFFTASNFVNPLVINSSEFVTFKAPFQTYYNSLTFNTPNLNYFELLTFNNETIQPAIVNDLSLDFSNVINQNFTIIGDLDYPKLRFVSIKNNLINQQSIEINNDNQGLIFCVDSIEQISSNYPNGGGFHWDLPQNTTITNNCTLGLQENDLNNNISSYPNPVEDYLNFKTELKINKVEVYDIVGRILSSKSINENKIDLSELKTGNYLLKLYNEKGIMNTKIIKE